MSIENNHYRADFDKFIDIAFSRDYKTERFWYSV